MDAQTDDDSQAVALLVELVALCKQEGLVRELATALGLRRQAVYQWEKSVRSRTAKLRLLEVSRVKAPRLAPAAAFATQAVMRVEGSEEECK